MKMGTVMLAAAAVTMTVFPSGAFADYAPTKNDVVGVGSDTLQQLGDFTADGDFLGDGGYNSAGNKNKFISIDATADANTRLAYGAAGVNAGTTPPPVCAPGDGQAVGTGNSGTQNTGQPCVLNPTVVLRAGKSPTQRPNGSGAGYKLLVADTATTGANAGKGLGYIDFSRSSSSQGSNVLFDSVQVGTDPLAMLTAATTDAVALTKAQLTSIYLCNTTDWSAVGGTAGTIIPLLPQIGSGTRKSFLAAIAVTTPGTCVQNVEENDPEAIGGTTSPVNAIEPMSGGRLNLFQGLLSTGASNGVGGYFNDPSCPFPPSESGTTTGCTPGAATLAPAVKFWGTSTGGYELDRPLYIYFRHADIASTKIFQPGGSLNWVRTMLYNPCPDPGVGDPNCTVVGTNEFGPGGAPWVASGAGQADISAAGIVPAYVYTASGP
jgi:hypothetical protein